MPAAAMLTEQKPPWAAIVGRAELHGPPARQRLALVAAGEEGELPGIGPAHVAQPLRRERQRLVPGDLLEVAGAALAHAQQRRSQPRRRVVLHDAGRALAAQHALVHGVVAVALDVADLAVLQVHADAAAAGAHVAGGGLDLVGRGHRQRLSLAQATGTGRASRSLNGSGADVRARSAKQSRFGRRAKPAEADFGISSSLSNRLPALLCS